MIQVDRHIRAFPTTMVASSPHELIGRFVPYDVIADALDELPDGKIDIYREGFRRGAFANQAQSREPGVLRRIGLVHTHDGGIGYLGPVVQLREEVDGLWGHVAVLRSKAGDVEDLLAAGVNELSVEFRVPGGLKNTSVEDGVRWRTRAHLDKIALEPKGAYTGAEVAAFRAEMDEIDKERIEAEIIHQSAEAEAEAALEAIAARKRRWDELTGPRLGEIAAKQAEYAVRFNLGQPG